MASTKESGDLEKYIKQHVGDILFEQISRNLSNLVVTVTKYVTEDLGEKLPSAIQKIVSLLEGWLKTRGYFLTQAERDFAIGTIRNIHEIKTGALKISGGPSSASVAISTTVSSPAVVETVEPAVVETAQATDSNVAVGAENEDAPRKKKFKLMKLFAKKSKKDKTVAPATTTA